MTETQFMTYDAMVEALNEADRLYYNDPDSSTMPDAEYDSMYADVLRIERETGGFSEDSPTQRVQGSSTFAPTKHSVPMLSLDKVTTAEELAKFLASVPEPVAYYVEPKLDGASLSLEFEDGKLIRAVTRGDGTTGDDVTANARLIRGIPVELVHGGEPFDGWIRGEVVIRTKDFDALNADGKFANPRNAAAGALRHNDPHEARRRRLTFYPYDSSDGLGHVQKMDGFLQYPYLPRFVNEVSEAVQELLQLRAAGGFEFDTDGIVIKVVSPEVRESLGFTGKHPKWAVAYKTAGDTATTKLNSITWQTGAGGMVTPVAELEPVYLDGTTISRATLHNAKFIFDKDVAPGSVVEIRRMGDVIPGVERVVERSTQRVTIPTHCPSCDAHLISGGNSMQVVCPNTKDCAPQLIGKLVKWAGRDAADIDAIGPSWIRTFVEAGLLKTPADFYTLTRASIQRFEGMGAKRQTQFIDSIEGSKGLGMRRALIGFCIPNSGEGTAKRLCRYFDSVEAISESCHIDLGTGGAERLKSIEDIGAVVAASIQEFFLENGQLVSDLRASGVNLSRLDEDTPVVKTATSKNFVVTGGFEGYKTRKEPVAILERLGWTSQSGISERTDYLITDDPSPTSSKAKKAASLGVEVITMAQAMELAGG